MEKILSEKPFIKIVNDDCLNYLKTIKDQSIDLVLTDPPYGVGVEYDNYKDNQENLKELLNKVMPELLRIGKRVLLTCGQDNIWLYPKSDWIIAWVIPAGANQNRWGFTCWQPILAYGKDPYRENNMGARPDYIQHNERSERNGHPCPKPIKFWERLLLRGSVKENDIILDPFAGSGTTLVAAVNLNRNAIGIEISEKYCAIAEERIMNVLKQGKLLI